MNKDPAFLFYSSDFLVGTQLLSYEEKGKYITLLCLAHQKGGYLTEREVFKICAKEDVDVLSKFYVDDNGIYYNERLLSEITKRSRYSESRRSNRNSKKDDTSNTYDSTYDNTYDITQSVHMENENISINNNALSSSLKENNNKDSIDIDYAQIVSYLNQKSNKSFRVTEPTKKLIKTRINEGFTIDNFYKVIDNQCSKWLNDPKMNDYLRPQTLFSNKFESYLNAKVAKKFDIMDL